MKEKTCCFTGHREIPESDYNLLKQKTKNAIVALIGKGVIYFGAGGARGFDTIAAETVLELKKDYPQIKLILVLPCPDQTKGWKEGDIRKYNIIKEKAYRANSIRYSLNTQRLIQKQLDVPVEF